MSLRVRPFLGREDLPAIAALIGSCSLESRHRIDYPWRLSSPAAETGRDVQLFWNEEEALVGFAAWYQPWAALDFYVRRGRWQRAVEDSVFAWAEQRFHDLDVERGHPLPYWAEAAEADLERLELLALHGYTLDDGSYSMLACDLARRPAAVPPPGVSIRPLAGERELEEYVTLHRRAFESDSMTVAWRRRTLTAPTYEPDLDLVAVAGGRLIGFCVGWLDVHTRHAQIEPLGIDPDHQRLGLGKAMIAAMLARFREHGADVALVETDSSRSSALSVYESAGFREVYRSHRKGRWFGEP
jgi:ribosomal protein S18 acetylase RimI-like enzyme